MSANEPLAIGVDIGGTGTKFGIVDRNGNVLFSSEMSTKKHKTVESFIDELYDHLRKSYNIYCTSRAGDTIQNMIYKGPEYLK